ncbi:MAG TPA: UDP-glucose--dolichyl-phosphate glucosyltransferase, partial [Bacteroidetes bacterium]|nr:UDP-glucose--dolichyl-phosphate glucosyltransferase [Bacteroidota bacterium]
MSIKVIIPAYNEEASIAKVISEIPSEVDEIIVVNNNSTDGTKENAARAGATVLDEERKGYGYACLKGMDYIAGLENQPTIIVFLDGDYSDYPEELIEVVRPIVEDDIDLVIGSRVKERREYGAMTPQQIFGNWLATKLIGLFFGANFTDLGPFRAIKYDKLLSLQMEDKTYGWT